MITENLSTLKIHNLTKEQYERELAAGRIDENALYLTPYEEQVQADWSQDDETQLDFIKNKPDEYDALELVMDAGLVSPAFAEDGSIYTDEDSVLYTL